MRRFKIDFFPRYFRILRWAPSQTAYNWFLFTPGTNIVAPLTSFDKEKKTAENFFSVSEKLFSVFRLFSFFHQKIVENSKDKRVVNDFGTSFGVKILIYFVKYQKRIAAWLLLLLFFPLSLKEKNCGKSSVKILVEIHFGKF